MNGTMDATVVSEQLESTSESMVSWPVKQEPLKEGKLQKQNGWLQGWKSYCFKIYIGKIFYKKLNAREENDNKEQEITVNKICVAEYSVNNFNNSFEVIVDNLDPLVLLSDTRKNMEEWIMAFKMCGHLNNHSELTDVLSGVHRWYSCSHSRPTFCNVCEQLLHGVTAKGLSCEVCRFKSHKTCASNAPRSCKWTTQDCIPPGIRAACCSEESYMPHQWIKGNIVDKKCTLCLKPCGNRKSLQDWTCLWCDSRVHDDCKLEFEKKYDKCTLGHNSISIIKPISIKRSSNSPELWESASSNHGSIPLIVFVNSKSGDNQGVRFMRRFKQVLNPAQVFDLGVAGPTLGLSMCKQFEQFRILVCGGDGSVGWVMTELDKQDLTNKCQLGVLPLGTGNDLARVLGWGTSCYDVGLIPHILKQLEHAKPCMLDRWSISIKEFSSAIPQDGSYFGYEDSITMQITRMLATNHHDIVLQSAKVLCQTVYEFVELVEKSTHSIDEDIGNVQEKIESDSIINKCFILQSKLQTLLQTLKIESNTSLSKSWPDHGKSWPNHGKSWPEKCRSNTMESVENSSYKNLADKKKYHSDITLTEDSSIKKNNSSIKFIQKEHLWSRANSLKNALRDIIDHTEKVISSQNEEIEAMKNQKTIESINNSNIMNNKLDRSNAIPCNDGESIKCIDELQKKGKNTAPNATIPQSSPFLNLQNISIIPYKKTSNTVVFPGTVISRAFQKPDISVSFISKVILANTSAICATAVAGMEGHEQIKNFKEKCVMNNYFGVGIDAKIALDFHNKREEHPEKYRSRTKNMIWYGVLGGKEILNRTYRNLDQNVHLEVDGHKINLPSLQGIVVLNIQSYIGGSNFWGTKKELDGFSSPSFDDKMLEVVAVLGASQMGMSKVFGGMQHHRISQCHSVKITITDESVPVQVDGEAWMQPPGIIQIIHKNRATMLKKDREFEEVLRNWHEGNKYRCTYEPLSEREGKLIKPVASAVLTLVKNVKTASLINSEVQQELYQQASSLMQMAEKLSQNPSACNSQESDEFVSLSKSFIYEVNAKLWTSQPQLSEELDSYITSSLKKANQELCFYNERFENKDSDDELEASSHLSNKMLNLFNRSSASCRVISPSDECIDMKPLTDWTIVDVNLWLDIIGCGEYKNIFFNNKIKGGRELIDLKERDLMEFGISNLDKIKYVINKLKELKHFQKTKPPSKWMRKTVL